MESKFKILSLSGGGARGIYTAKALEVLESRFQTQIANHFDIICGTSIGGILALGLAAEIPASKILKVFDENREKIFPAIPEKEKKPIPVLNISKADIRQIKQPQYTPEPLKALLEELFGDKLIGDLKHCVLIPSINFTVGRLRAFRTPHAEKLFQDAKCKIVDVALATSAAPTYFPVHTIDGTRYVDGGLVANSPVLMGVTEAYSSFNIPLESVTALCIGNMGKGLAANHEKGTELGYKAWGFGQDIINLTMSVGEQQSFDLANLLLQGRLELIDSEAVEEQSHLLSLDNGSDAAAQILKAHAENSAGEASNKPEIKAFFENQKKFYSEVRNA